jgi:hypothetical protein
MSNPSNESASNSWIEHKELRVEVADQWGWLDRLILFPQARHATLFDLKTGRYSVDPAETNLQIWGYSVGIWDSFDFIDTIDPHIIIPRRNEVHHALFSRQEDYERQKNEVFKIIERAKLESGKIYNPGWFQCRFCDNKVACEALRSFVNQIVPRYNQEFIIPDPIHPSEITDIQTLDHTFLLGRVIEKWYESLRFHITQLAREGYEFEHFKLVEITGQRRITRPVRLWEILQEKGWDLNTFLNCCEVSVTKLDSEVGNAAPRGLKNRTKELFNLDLQDENVLEIGPPTYQMRTKAL